MKFALIDAGKTPPTPAFLLRCAVATRRARRAAKAAGSGRASTGHA